MAASTYERSNSPVTHLSARLCLESLETRENPAVHYFGGNLLPHVEAQPVYYGTGWSSLTGLRGYTDAFLKDVTGGAYMDALTRAGYGVGRGTAASGIIDPISLTSGSMISDASIQARLSADIRAGRLPAPDANRLYVVYVQPNVAVNLGNGQGTTRQGILGYHGAFAGPNGATIRYVVVPFPGGAARNSSMGTTPRDQLTAVASHELAEAVTDPDVNFGQLGWYDPALGEIGDITENNPNALVRLDGYLVQEVASKNDQLLPITAAPLATNGTGTTLTAGSVSYHGYYATVTLTVTVRPASGTAAPGGTVDLLYNGQVLGSATLHVVNGVATASFNIMFFANGNYTFSAEYAGTPQFATSTSPSTTVFV